MGDWVWHACMMTYNNPSRDHARHNLINLEHGSFDGLNIRNGTNFLVFLVVCWVPEQSSS